MMLHVNYIGSMIDHFQSAHSVSSLVHGSDCSCHVRERVHDRQLCGCYL